MADESSGGGGTVGWVVGLVIGAVILSAFVFQLMRPIIGRGGHHHHAVRTRCASNLKQIGLACIMYASDNDGLYPANLLQILDYVGDAEVFACPASGREPPELIYGQRDIEHDYTYLPGCTDDTPDAGKRPIVYEHAGNHRDYHNVLFADGHVQFFHGPTWRDDAGITAVEDATRNPPPDDDG